MKFIATTATSLKHIDMRTAEEMNIDVISMCGLPGSDEITSSAEYTMGLLLCLIRNITLAHRAVIQGEWNAVRFTGSNLKGKTLGLVGLGRTGRAFGSLAEAFKMEVIYYDPKVEDPYYDRCEYPHEIANRSDILSVHATPQDDLEGLLDGMFFSYCQNNCLVINTNYAEVIKEKTLLDALRNHHIGGAALDVLRSEPEAGLAFKSPLVEYARIHGNLLLTPHMGTATNEVLLSTGEPVVDEIISRFTDS